MAATKAVQQTLEENENIQNFLDLSSKSKEKNKNKPKSTSLITLKTNSALS